MWRSGFLGLMLIGLLGCSPGQNQKDAFVGVDIKGASFGQGFELPDHHGQVRKLSDFKGKLVALFFGYTNCPDVCPTTLDDLTKGLALLGERKSEVQVLFVTLDPERDTPERLAQYVPSFNPGYLALRGTPEQTAATASSFKVFYQRQLSASKAGYTIDHSAGVYVFDKQGTLRLYLNFGQKPEDIAHDLMLLLQE